METSNVFFRQRSASLMFPACLDLDFFFVRKPECLAKHQTHQIKPGYKYLAAVNGPESGLRTATP